MAKMDLVNVNYADVKKKREEVETTTEQVNKMVDEIVKKYCEDTDKLLAAIKDILFAEKDNELSNTELDNIVLKLPVLVYFANAGQEYVGLQEDVAKFARQLKFSEFFNQAAGTVADKTNYAETKANEEEVVRVVYSRAYKIIRGKMDMALELLQSAKKVISRRMGETQIPTEDINAR